jgi:hypothetical protein
MGLLKLIIFLTPILDTRALAKAALGELEQAVALRTIVHICVLYENQN